MPRITFQADDKTVEVEPEDWFYDVCVASGASIPFSCKAGACGTCATEVLGGAPDALPPPSQRELRTLAEQGLDPARFRLPCLHVVQEDLVFGRSAHTMGEARTLPVREAEVEAHRRLNLGVCEVRFFVPGEELEFQPGQYVIFQIPSASSNEIVRRSYSISTPPSDRRHFEICVRSIAGGHGSNWVHRLRPGRTVSFEGPMGDFTLAEGDRDILMVAIGTGMSPIKSMLLHLLDQRSDRRVRLFFGVRSVHDLFYTDLLRGLAAHYPSFSSAIALSSPDPAAWAGRPARVTDLVRDQVTPEQAGSSEAYLCGSRAMVDDVISLLRGKGMAEEHIHTENFY
jgi:Na+-transporting NADH:ubiquinone oxidoreductase subunit F